MIDCREVLKRLWEFLDGELDAKRAREIDAHLAVCQRCYPRYQFELAFLRAVLGAHGPAEPPRPEFVSRLRGALAAMMGDR